MRLEHVELESGRELHLHVPPEGCGHLDQIRDVQPLSAGCEECLALGDGWVHLRICLSCGRVGCCDSSKNKHAAKHQHEMGHAIIGSLEPGEDWLYCYPDDALMEPIDD